jgi:RNA polymerase sigma-70 factor (ECF subfamily)
MDERESGLVERVLRGDSDAFGPLVTPYRKALLSMAYRLCRNWEDAGELSQETLLRAFRYLRSYDPRRSFRNWMFQILVNVWRSSWKNEPDGAALREWAAANAAESPEEEHDRSEVRSQLMECLDALSRREREVFLLRDIEEMSILETAEALGTSPLSVRVRLSLARKKIRERAMEKFPHLMEGRS